MQCGLGPEWPEPAPGLFLLCLMAGEPYSIVFFCDGWKAMCFVSAG